MAKLREVLAEKIPAWREEIKSLTKGHGDKVVGSVTLQQAYGGQRGVIGLVTDTSDVQPDFGLRIRGIPIKELDDKLPEEIFYLLLAGELPDQEGLDDMVLEMKRRKGVPSYVWDVLQAMPADSHPMAMFNTGILVMEGESVFRKRYNEGMTKNLYWEAALEDALNCVAKLPELAAGVYRLRYGKGPRIPSDPTLDMGADYAHMLGIPDPTGDFANLMRLYLVLHSDHEGGNVSAFSSHTVGSALSDIFYALSAGLNGLAGPLHGLANQECLNWILQVREKFGGVPTHDQLRDFAWETLNSGKVIPGYGHAVLRVTDPRFEAFVNFGKKAFPEDEIFATVVKVFEVIPGVLQEHGKAKNPWPNVDAASGSLLYHFGLKEFEYYTVLFAVSRAMGICSQNVISRAMGYAIVRPKSVTTQWLMNKVS